MPMALKKTRLKIALVSEEFHNTDEFRGGGGYIGGKMTRVGYF